MPSHISFMPDVITPFYHSAFCGPGCGGMSSRGKRPTLVRWNQIGRDGHMRRRVGTTSRICHPCLYVGGVNVMYMAIGIGSVEPTHGCTSFSRYVWFPPSCRSAAMPCLLPCLDQGPNRDVDVTSAIQFRPEGIIRIRFHRGSDFREHSFNTVPPTSHAYDACSCDTHLDFWVLVDTTQHGACR